MIKSKEDLLGKKVKISSYEDYLDVKAICEKFGITQAKWSSCDYNKECCRTYGVLISNNIGSTNKKDVFLIVDKDDYISDRGKVISFFALEEISLSSFKNSLRETISYEKVDKSESFFSLQKEFEKELLFFAANGGLDNMKPVETELHLSQLHFNTNGCFVYRKVVKVIDWKEEVLKYTNNFVNNNPLDTARIRTFSVDDLVNMYPERFLEICRITLRATGELPS
jgi:hypothetical protein